MNPEQIARRRLVNQRLVGSTITAPAEVVRLLGAVQAQDYAGAAWGVGLRTRDAARAGVDRALADGSIIRTHVLRPTWHVVAPADLRWMLALTAPRIRAAMAYHDRQLGLDDAVVRRSNAALARALRGGRQLTRAELADVLRRSRVDVTGSQRLSHLLLRAELDAIVCSGARRGKQFTYALFDERVPPAAARDRDDALHDLTTRYFATRGPATVNDFAWWSGLTVADAKEGVHMMGSALDREVIGDRTYWFAPGARPRRAGSPIAHLLPNYDEYVVSFADRGAVAVRLPPAGSVTAAGAIMNHIVIVDGQLVGWWKRTVTRTAAVVDVRLLARLSEAEARAVAAAADAYGTFLGLPVELRGVRAAA